MSLATRERMSYLQESWLDPDFLKKEFSSTYWNDEAAEADKSFNVRNGFEALETDEHTKSIYDSLRDISEKSSLDWKDKSILSLGSGICWLEAWFFKDKDFGALHALDFSRHRIFDLAPLTLSHYGLPEDRVKLVHGSFLDLKLPDSSQDIVLMSQAFHHCDEPIRLLKEVKRVLKPSGRILIIGEHYFSKWDIFIRSIKHLAKYILNHKGHRKSHSAFPQYKSLFPPCQLKGDHHYSITDYHYMFSFLDFDYQRYTWPKYKVQGFSLLKK